MKKFELTAEFKMFFGKKLFRIKALIDFGDVKAEECGGYIEEESNLDQSGNARVSGDADILHVTGLGTVHRTTRTMRSEHPR